MRPVPVLEIGAPGTGLVYLRRAVAAGDTFTYRFVHSVSRTEVEEVWVVVPGPAAPGLRLRAIRYQATGAGLPAGPDEPGATFEATPGGFVIRGLDRPIGLPLDLRVTPAAGNTLEVGGGRLDLTALPAADGAGHASLVRVTLRWMAWLRVSLLHREPAARVRSR